MNGDKDKEYVQYPENFRREVEFFFARLPGDLEKKIKDAVRENQRCLGEYLLEYDRELAIGVTEFNSFLSKMENLVARLIYEQGRNVSRAYLQGKKRRIDSMQALLEKKSTVRSLYYRWQGIAEGKTEEIEPRRAMIG